MDLGHRPRPHRRRSPHPRRPASTSTPTRRRLRRRHRGPPRPGRRRLTPHTCRAHIAPPNQDADTVESLFTQAALAWEKASRPLETAHAFHSAARHRLHQDLRHGQKLGNRALEIYWHLGAQWDSRHCHRLLRRHELTPDNKRGPLGYGDGLSPREHQVARLAAQGHTNRAIAEKLHVSARTAEHHVASVLRKLGVDSRTQIAAALDEQAPRV
ncbi:LuxR C-terminal-related transcriptional regulator [Streptomyces sp. NPDC006530]|uniref:helix-turn-helix transcriptional regulator n=1 Tax=Streptomyces sp. NPDC006530 TaxID=3364750 RepID=UPI00368495A4